MTVIHAWGDQQLFVPASRYCAGIDAAYGDLTAAGVPAIQQPRDTGNNNRNALVRDPDVNLVEIVAKRS